MLDDILSSPAQTGVILLTLPTSPSEEDRRARTAQREPRSITDERGGVSNSIVRTVLTTTRPIIVSDALADTGQQERSVVTLQLSASCRSHASQGGVIGACVGNGKVKHLFSVPSSTC